MMTSRCKSILFAVSLLFLAGAISSPWAHALDLNIFDGDPTEEQCRICHDDQVFNTDRHHLLLDTVIPEPDESLAPDAPAVPGELYDCQSCHDMLHLTFDCLYCHPAWIVTGRGTNVHHNLSLACRVCH
ncbi:MAG: hypothetical protein MUO63_21035 [Desulfobulbaceae bacterium]|nr:hypothetical protein [Desulfobulbaceae bacterium]